MRKRCLISEGKTRRQRMIAKIRPNLVMVVGVYGLFYRALESRGLVLSLSRILEDR